VYAIQQKYWDHGRSAVLSSRSRPIFRARSSWGFWWNSEERVDLPIREETRRLRERMGDPDDVRTRIDAHVGQDARGEDVLWLPQAWNGDLLSLEVADRAHALGTEQLEAAGVDTGQDDDRSALVQADDEGAAEVQRQVHLSGGYRLREEVPRLERNVLDVGEPLEPKQVLREIQGCDADGRAPHEPDAGRLGRRLGRESRARLAKQTGARCRQSFDEGAPLDHPFSSFLSSLMNRQSVPWAMSF
jgi:hypothetical protein